MFFKGKNAPDRILLAQRKAPILEKLAKAKQTAAGEKNLEKFKSVSFVNNDKTKEEKSQPQKIEYEKPKIIEPPKPIHVREEVAKIAGVSNGTVAKFEQVQKKKPEMIESIRKGDVSINQAYNKIKLEEKKETVRQAEQKIAEQATNDTKPILYIRDSIGYKPTEKYDLLLTDPPYSTDVDDIDRFVDRWLYNALDGVKDTGFAYIFIGAYPKELKAYLNAKIPDRIELCQQLVWTYKNTLGNNPKDRYKQNYQAGCKQ